MFDPVSTEAMVTMMIFFGSLPMIWQSTQLFYTLSSKLAEKIYLKSCHKETKSIFGKLFYARFLFTLQSPYLFLFGSDVSCCMLDLIVIFYVQFMVVVPRSKVDAVCWKKRKIHDIFLKIAWFVRKSSCIYLVSL